MRNQKTSFQVRTVHGDFFEDVTASDNEELRDVLIFESLDDALVSALDFIKKTQDGAVDGHMLDETTLEDVEIVEFTDGEIMRVITAEEAVREQSLAHLHTGSFVHWTNPFAGDPDELAKLQARETYLVSDDATLTTGVYEVTLIDTPSETIESPDTIVRLVSTNGYEVSALASELNIDPEQIPAPKTTQSMRP